LAHRCTDINGEKLTERDRESKRERELKNSLADSTLVKVVADIDVVIIDLGGALILCVICGIAALTLNVLLFVDAVQHGTFRGFRLKGKRCKR